MDVGVIASSFAVVVRISEEAVRSIRLVSGTT